MPQALAFIERVANDVANQDFYYWGITQQGNPKRNGFVHLQDRVDEGHEWNWVYGRGAS